MSGPRQKGKIVLSYLARFPEMATRTLAKKIFKEKPGIWSNLERVRSGIRYYRGQKGEVARSICVNEDHFTEPGDDRRGFNAEIIPVQTKILIFDIETVPNLAYVWGCLKQFISAEQIVETSRIMCFAAQWLGQKKVIFDSVWNDPIIKDYGLGITRDDKRLCQHLWDLFDEADIVVAHNGRAFDSATLRTRWVDHGFGPPSPYKIYDTLTEAKKRFNFPRNTLNCIAQYLGVGQKMEHEGWPLWIKCMNGVKKAQATMKKYNIMDIEVLKGVYFKLRPWSTMHPNVALDYEDGHKRCTICGSTALTELAKDARTSASKFPSFRCKSCGHVMRSRKRHKPVGNIEDRLANAI